MLKILILVTDLVRRHKAIEPLQSWSCQQKRHSGKNEEAAMMSLYSL